MTASPQGVTFATMEEEAPELAQWTHERFAASGLSLVGTLRTDGWPRISPVEPLVSEGQLYLGMMPRSMKSLDLARDSRCLVHSTITDKDGGDGEVKLYGHGRRIDDPDEIERYCVALEAAIGWRPGADEVDLWVLDLTSAAYVHFAEGVQTIATWTAGEKVQTYVKSHTG